jgi:oligopeptide/dipeptide ABC transporter ATP-binding protein
MTASLLSVRSLETAFTVEGAVVPVLDRVSFELYPGQTVGVVGESGCGKSVAALSIMRLLPQPSGRITGGQVLLDGSLDLVSLPAEEMRTIRGRRIGMIFQEPMTALNPVHTVGRQLAEVYERHRNDIPRNGVVKECVAMLEQVGIPAPEKRLGEFPHQLSGGMRQRVMIAMALATEPDLLIADEPTTALDVTIQAQILTLMEQLQQKSGTALLFITHDLGVIAEICDRVVVMYAGQVVETGLVDDLFHATRHPYTRGLLSSIPRLAGTPKTRLATIDGMVPPLDALPAGCRFSNRCPFVIEHCRNQRPELAQAAPGHQVRCHRHEEVYAS